jgi:ABC-type Fe3+/spermidine/putrescine transport system ATPase subunit
LGRPFAHGETVRILTRPEDIEILPGGRLQDNQFAAKIQQADYLGDHFEYHVQIGGATFLLSANKKQRYRAGAEVRLNFDPDRLTLRRL